MGSGERNEVRTQAQLGVQRQGSNQLGFFSAHYIGSTVRVRARYAGYDGDSLVAGRKSQQGSRERCCIKGAWDVCGFFPAITRAHHPREIGCQWAMLMRPGRDQREKNLLSRNAQRGHAGPFTPVQYLIPAT